MSFLSVVFWKQNVQFDALENNKNQYYSSLINVSIIWLKDFYAAYNYNNSEN